MQSFLELRDGLRCLDHARRTNNPFTWLQAALDVKSSLVGENGRKPAIPELIGVLGATKNQLNQLAEQHPKFSAAIKETCETIDAHSASLRDCVQQPIDFLCQNPLIHTFCNSSKKHDLLAHKALFPQCMDLIWQSHNYAEELNDQLQDTFTAVSHLDAMLSDFVPWKMRTATGGSDHITPERGSEFGLLIVGLPKSTVEAGVLPDLSGNRLAIRVRFVQWLESNTKSHHEQDQPYQMMLVPVA